MRLTASISPPTSSLRTLRSGSPSYPATIADARSWRRLMSPASLVKKTRITATLATAPTTLAEIAKTLMNCCVS